MNKAELAAEIAARTNNTKKAVEEILGSLTDVVIEAVAKGDRVTLVGFGTFERRERQARETNNPQKPGQKIKVPAKKVPAFSAGKERVAHKSNSHTFIQSVRGGFIPCPPTLFALMLPRIFASRFIELNLRKIHAQIRNHPIYR
ncbi:MAG: HU family DNA-binding protein [Candidatus Obscuribacterales bacterium]